MVHAPHARLGALPLLLLGAAGLCLPGRGSVSRVHDEAVDQHPGAAVGAAAAASCGGHHLRQQRTSSGVRRCCSCCCRSPAASAAPDAAWFCRTPAAFYRTPCCCSRKPALLTLLEIAAGRMLLHSATRELGMANAGCCEDRQDMGLCAVSDTCWLEGQAGWHAEACTAAHARTCAHPAHAQAHTHANARKHARTRWRPEQEHACAPPTQRRGAAFSLWGAATKGKARRPRPPHACARCGTPVARRPDAANQATGCAAVVLPACAHAALTVCTEYARTRAHAHAHACRHARAQALTIK